VEARHERYHFNENHFFMNSNVLMSMGSAWRRVMKGIISMKIISPRSRNFNFTLEEKEKKKISNGHLIK